MTRWSGFLGRVVDELGRIDADLREQPPFVYLVLSCLALLLACSIAFGGVHL